MRAWRQEEEDYLIENYRHESIRAMGKHLKRAEVSIIARAEELNLKRNNHTTKFKPNKNMTFGEWYEWRIENYLIPGKRRVTVNKYWIDLDKVNDYGLGELKLTSIKRVDIQKYVEKLGRDLRKQTMLDHMGKVKSAFSDAVLDGWITVNPAGRYEFVSKEMFMSTDELKEIREEKQTLELDEYYRFIGFLKSYIKQLSEYPIRNKQLPRITIATIIYISAKTGARFAEVLGLTESDINFDERLIGIEKTWNYKSSKGDFAKTKNSASIRKVEVDDDTLEVLEIYLKWLTRYEVDLSKGAIFVPNGNRVHNSTINNLLGEITKTIGIERITLHKLRHTHASILIANNVPLQVIAKRLGHTDTNMIQRVYGHLLEVTEDEGNRMIMRLI